MTVSKLAIKISNHFTRPDLIFYFSSNSKFLPLGNLKIFDKQENLEFQKSYFVFSRSLRNESLKSTWPSGDKLPEAHSYSKRYPASRAQGRGT